MIIPFNFATKGIPHLARAGRTVQFSLPEGCALYVSTNLTDWQLYTAASPFIVNEDTHVRIDCETFSNYVEATLVV